jgi:hypothetical protein
MKIYIAKHYWKDGENATWESHVKVDKKIFEHLKKNYHNFVNNRPLIIEERKKYIYLCYEDTVDIYNRKITNITFFVSKYKVNEPLCKKIYHNLELHLSNKRQMNFFLKLFVVSVGLFFIYNFVFDSENSNTQMDESNNSMLENIVSKNKVMQEGTLKNEVKKKEKIIKVIRNDRYQTKKRVKIDYTQIIDNWNKQVQNNTAKRDFLLTRESNDEMMVQLENWMKNFYIPKTTYSLEYNQFLEKNKFGKPIYFDSSMSKDKVRELLKKATKEKVMSKIVKKVLMMNDIELWEKLRK